ncbi:MAG: hypothetical protein ACYCZD_08240 [Rhodanobacter sp.]
MPSPTTPPADSLLQHRAFVAFWFARVASGFGFQMLSVAVGWQIYAITGCALDLGLIGLVQFLPSVLLALPAGQAAMIMGPALAACRTLVGRAARLNGRWRKRIASTHCSRIRWHARHPY